MRPILKKGSPEAIAWGERMKALRKRVRYAGRKTEQMFFRGGKLKPYGGMEPNKPKSRHPFTSCVKKVSKSLKRYGQAGDPRKICGATIKRAKKNPIAIYGLGNPHKIAGVIYNRVIEVRAEKTGSWKPGLYRHPFDKSSQVCMLALDNGDILLHSKAGKRLWEKA